MTNKITLDSKGLEAAYKILEMQHGNALIKAKYLSIEAAITAYLQAIKPAESEVETLYGIIESQKQTFDALVKKYKAMQPKPPSDVGLREALEFYARPETYEHFGMSDDSAFRNIDVDLGAIAIQALAAQPEKPSDAGLRELINQLEATNYEIGFADGKQQPDNGGITYLRDNRARLQSEIKQALANPAPDNEHKELLERFNDYVTLEKTGHFAVHRSVLFNLIGDLAAALTTKE